MENAKGLPVLFAELIDVAEKLAIPIGVIIGILLIVLTKSGRKDFSDGQAKGKGFREWLTGKRGGRGVTPVTESLTPAELKRRGHRSRFCLGVFILLMPVGCIGPLSLILIIPGESAREILGPIAFVLFLAGLTGTILVAWDLARYRQGQNENSDGQNKTP